MSNIAIFNFENQTVRTALKGSEPYFCLADVSEILSLQSRATSTFNLDEKGIEKIQITDSLNRKQTATFISEPNLYRVIFRSNKAEAVKFQNWVFDEVLPSIRKTGSYRHTTSHDRTPLRQAVTALSGKLGIIHSEAYALVHQYMGVEHIDEIALDDLPRAVEYVHRLMMRQPAHGEENAFWRMVGVLEYRRISNELTELQESLDTVSRKLNRIVKTKGLLYDSLGEQRHPYHPDTKAQAQEFIARQMAMKKQIGLI